MLRDITGEVPLDDPAAAARAVDAILTRSFGSGSFDCKLLHAAFAHAGALYGGEVAGYLRCDMPYHDLRHALDTALAAARLVDGCRRAEAPGSGELTPELGLATVLLALLHDTGFLRTAAEASLRGPQLAATHESRSVAVAANYLATTACAAHGRLAGLIVSTRLSTSPAEVVDARPPAEALIGCVLGTVDLLCQMADVLYLERCFHHLYPELVLGGGDRRTTPDGREEVLFGSGRDLVRGTPAFHDGVARPRLEHGLRNVVRHLEAHFGGPDPYLASVRANRARCASIVDGDRWDRIGPTPPTTTRPLDPAYGPAAFP